LSSSKTFFKREKKGNPSRGPSGNTGTKTLNGERSSAPIVEGRFSQEGERAGGKKSKGRMVLHPGTSEKKDRNQRGQIVPARGRAAPLSRGSLLGKKKKNVNATLDKSTKKPGGGKKATRGEEGGNASAAPKFARKKACDTTSGRIHRGRRLS